jgi:hypothetical protein
LSKIGERRTQPEPIKIGRVQENGMKALYRELGLDVKEAARITADVVEIILKRLPDVEAIRLIEGKYDGRRLCFALLLLGRLAGMSFALSNSEKARAILADFSRLVAVLERDGKDRLVKVIEEEILEEVYSELERLKDVQ